MQIHDWTRVSAGVVHDFHIGWTVELQRVLNRCLPAAGYAMVERVVPEVVVQDIPVDEIGGGVVIDVATAPPRVAVTATLDEPAAYAQRRRRIAVRHRSGDRLVAMIEIVSPGNKDRHASVDMFAGKAVDAIHTGLHLLVIDPFPPGRHDPGGMHGVIWDRPRRQLCLRQYQAFQTRRLSSRRFMYGLCTANRGGVRAAGDAVVPHAGPIYQRPTRPDVRSRVGGRSAAVAGGDRGTLGRVRKSCHLHQFMPRKIRQLLRDLTDAGIRPSWGQGQSQEPRAPPRRKSDSIG